MSASITELRSRLKALRTMHGSTCTPEERAAWQEEDRLLRQVAELLLERANARAVRQASPLREVSP